MERTGLEGGEEKETYEAVELVDESQTDGFVGPQQGGVMDDA